MMSNETFALLTPVVIFLAVAATAALAYWDIVRRHPVKVKKKRQVDSLPGASGKTRNEISKNDELDQQIAIRLRENAASTAELVREAKQLASSVERFTKAVTGAK